MKDLMVICPTVVEADQLFRRFCEKNQAIIEKIKKFNHTVTLTNGQNIFFKGETEGQKVLLGYHGNVISSYEFSQVLE